MIHSLRTKVVLMIIVIALVLNVVTIIVSVRSVSNIIENNYKTEATNVSRTAAAVVDAKALARLQAETEKIYDALPSAERVSSDDWGSDEFYEYLSNFEALSQTPDYKKVLRQLRTIQDTNDVDCVYTSFVEKDSAKFVYLVDAAEEDPCPIGCFDPLYEQNQRLLEDPTIGFPTYTTNTEEYGHLATSGTPVYSSEGEVVGYAMVDVSMTDIASWRHRVLAILIGLQILLTAIVILFSVILVNRALVRPINQLSQAATNYRSDDDVSNHNHFEKLEIHTHDEIENLATSMKRMEWDLNDKITNLLKTTNELAESRQEVTKMSEIATRDALTGVQNKYSYDDAMKALAESVDEDPNFGLAVIDLNELKKINDTYGHEKGDIAIKELCRIVCTTFTHSPVYRIGGDEFTVILKGRDLENIDDLITRFNCAMVTVSQNADLEPWERVSASVGYAVFDADRDGTPDGTFRRADRAMYMRKQEMKAGRD